MTNKRFLITAVYPFSVFRFVFTDILIAALEKEILDLNAELSALKQTLVQLDGTAIRLEMRFIFRCANHYFILPIICIL